MSDIIIVNRIAYLSKGAPDVHNVVWDYCIKSSVARY